MKKDDIIKKAGGSLLRPIGVINLLSWFGIVASIFCIIWNVSFAYKLLLSSLFTMVISAFTYWSVKKIISELVDKYFPNIK